MNKTLFKADFKLNWIPFSAVVSMIMIYVSVSIAMFNPEDAAAIQAIFSMMPEALVNAFGFNGIGTDLTTYLAAYFYGFILLVFPLVYSIIVANSLVAGHVDKGSMAYLLSTPNSKIKIISTQAIYFVVSIAALLGLIVSAILILSGIIWPGQLELGSFMRLNLVTLFLLIAVGSISFLMSCIFNETKYSLALGAGIPVLFVMFKLISEISEKVEILKYLTPYALLDTTKILDNVSYSTNVSIILIIFSIITFTLSIIIFNRKNLNI